jgi:hypothetical protein
LPNKTGPNAFVERNDANASLIVQFGADTQKYGLKDFEVKVVSCTRFGTAEWGRAVGENKIFAVRPSFRILR